MRGAGGDGGSGDDDSRGSDGGGDDGRSDGDDDGGRDGDGNGTRHSDFGHGDGTRGGYYGCGTGDGKASCSDAHRDEGNCTSGNDNNAVAIMPVVDRHIQGTMHPKKTWRYG